MLVHLFLLLFLFLLFSSGLLSLWLFNLFPPSLLLSLCLLRRGLLRRCWFLGHELRVAFLGLLEGFLELAGVWRLRKFVSKSRWNGTEIDALSVLANRMARVSAVAGVSA